MFQTHVVDLPGAKHAVVSGVYANRYLNSFSELLLAMLSFSQVCTFH